MTRSGAFPGAYRNCRNGRESEGRIARRDNNTFRSRERWMQPSIPGNAVDHADPRISQGSQVGYRPHGRARRGVSMSELSRDDVVSVVGPIGDAAIAEIIATGISRDQLVAAKNRVIQDR